MLSYRFIEKMEIAHYILLRMALSMLSLLLLIQLPAIPASAFVLQPEVCKDQFAYTNSNGQDLFYINGDSVQKFLYCDSLQKYYANGCMLEGDIGRRYCGLVLSLVDFSFKTARKLMHNEPKDGSPIHHGKDLYMFTTKTVGIAASGALLVCCVFLCPCFYKKRRETAHNALAKDTNSMDNSPSFEVKPHAAEKISASPHRVPPSPRYTASPHRVPPSPRYTNSPKLSRLGSVYLNLSQIARATRNFSKSQLIGEGGFGTVYKARLADGQVVSIKRAKKELFENLQTEFSSEVDLLAKIDHRNLVKLLGYVDEGNERLIITEYVPNGNLREHLDGQLGKALEFNQRLEIAIDVAHALTYLHLYAEKPIIHRDVKSSNILLTESMRAKVADFGFARLGPMDTDRTHISTKVKGTVGYLDPEYMKTYQLTVKSDVYSFGILLIEIVTGRRPVELKRPVEERVTLRWAFKKLNEGLTMELIDPVIEETVDADVLMKIFDLAIQCAAPVRADRPDMKTVGEQLWTIRADYLKSLKRE
ncbi:calmodulin-binding receptor-like cytoplasmic kinase 3 [Argentina anserina]|uniref:calmodulin-binding receptor-like cytoplasmic kinase 3 n=1 Tax=Argentina anserina TaxID=57926 RepID=UPI00217644AD|nr:calmodulin-binding receptor-like cytoplasmic kinase 3 [Potentilla anserina]XP_050388180.1 calmodulin-binding receptor-like cytoplasmic kinase 3 [Potentilla anserina]XP_050388181.1 calmodulin-binding receptor-like cytoplasmic kinase 3 [Potentilla anserina]